MDKLDNQINNLNQIKNLVNQKVKEKQSEIIMNIYRVMIIKHNDFCSCNYCDKLKEYVSLKRFKNRRIKEFSERNYFQHISDLILDNNEIEKFNYRIKNLKIEKDKLKLINI